MFSFKAWAFQCPPEYSIDKAFVEADRAFLAYVTDTKLEEELKKDLSKNYPEMDKDSEAVKLVSAGYRIVEEFKGAADYQPRLIDLLGIGTGYVGLTPGVYYLVLLPKGENNNEYKGMRVVNICSVPISHYRLKVPQFQEKLDEVRKLKGVK